jgi:outer membrane protein assembly factor BamB
VAEGELATSGEMAPHQSKHGAGQAPPATGRYKPCIFWPKRARPIKLTHMKKAAPYICAIATLFLLGMPARASDWPQFLGPNRSGIAPDISMGDAPTLEPQWEQNVGIGYSGVAVVGNRAYTMGHDGSKTETLFALHAKTGEIIWSHAYTADLIAKYHKGGPNATPTVDGHKLYVVSKDGQLFCMNTSDGSVVWQINLTKDLDVPLPAWGFASSPLLRDGRLYMNAGHPFALNADDGARVWTTPTEFVAGYSTAVLMQHQDAPVMLSLFGNQVGVLRASDGELLASQPIKASWKVSAATPIVLDAAKGHFYVATSKVGRAVRFDGSTLTTLWETRAMKNNMNTCVLIGGHLYGVDGKHGSKGGKISCVNAADGSLQWSEPLGAYGSLVATSTHLLVLSEKGELVIAKVDPTAFTPLLRRNILDGTCWTPLSLANDCLYARNELGRVICLSLAQKTP